MDALDALSAERPVLSTRLRRERVVAERPSSSADDLHEVRRLLGQLPVLTDGSWSPTAAPGPDEASLRITVALWGLAARHGLAVAPEDNATEIARRLARRGALAPPAAEAVEYLERMLDDPAPADTVDICRSAARLTAYLELRASFG